MSELADRLARIVAGNAPAATLLGIATALVVSAVVAWLLVLLYEFFYEHRETGSQIHRSFLLICPSITLLFVVVQVSLPLSLGLLGALSIVRFRVPIREPEEVGFLMVAIATSIACATYMYAGLAILLAVVTAVLGIRHYVGPRLFGTGTEGLLVIAVRDDAFRHHAAGIEDLLRARLGRVRLDQLSGQAGVTSVNYAFRAGRRVPWALIQRELSDLCPLESVTVLPARPGGW
jgi:hypothetical protein